MKARNVWLQRWIAFVSVLSICANLFNVSCVDMNEESDEAKMVEAFEENVELVETDDAECPDSTDLDFSEEGEAPVAISYDAEDTIESLVVSDETQAADVLEESVELVETDDVECSGSTELDSVEESEASTETFCEEEETVESVVASDETQAADVLEEDAEFVETNDVECFLSIGCEFSTEKAYAEIPGKEETTVEILLVPEGVEEAAEEEDGLCPGVLRPCFYAPKGYTMLSVNTALEDGMCWAFAGEPLFAMPDGSYCLLISESFVVEGSLSGEGIELLCCIPGQAPVLSLNGDVNLDGNVNIADANTAFQLVSQSADYYSVEQFTLYQRMLTDMDGDMMYTIADVNAILECVSEGE